MESDYFINVALDFVFLYVLVFYLLNKTVLQKPGKDTGKDKNG